MSDIAHSIDPTRLPGALKVIGERLRSRGHLVYLVGGCLRDLLRGVEPHDWDLATSAVPRQVAEIFPRTVPTGERFGTMMVLEGDGRYEVTTLRRDIGYSDGRHPDRVIYTDQIALDLERRDFTINAMAADLATWQIYDPSDGRGDLERRLIRAVGEPAERFNEDALRLLRACRQAAELEFTIEGETRLAMREAAGRIAHISAERVHDEIMKLMERAEQPSRCLEAMIDTGLLAVLIPELVEGDGVTQNRYHRFDVLTHALKACDRVPREQPLVRLAALLHDVGKPRTRAVKDGEATFYGHEAVGTEMTDAILERLRFSNQEREVVTGLVRHHMFQYTSEWSAAAVRRFIRRVGEERLDDLFVLREADAAASGCDAGRAEELRELRRRVDHELVDDETGYQRHLALDGRDIMTALGLAEGPEVGRWLTRLEEAVLDRPEWNTRERLLELLAEWAAADDQGETTGDR
jgi:putative nucleotidyltransferase with HDIG domain